MFFSQKKIPFCIFFILAVIINLYKLEKTIKKSLATSRYYTSVVVFCFTWQHRSSNDSVLTAQPKPTERKVINELNYVPTVLSVNMS